MYFNTDWFRGWFSGKIIRRYVWKNVDKWLKPIISINSWQNFFLMARQTKIKCKFYRRMKQYLEFLHLIFPVFVSFVFCEIMCGRKIIFYNKQHRVWRNIALKSQASSFIDFVVERIVFDVSSSYSFLQKLSYHFELVNCVNFSYGMCGK